MAILINEFTGTDGVALTAPLSGASGSTAFDAVAADKMYFSTLRAVNGSSSVRVPPGTGASVRWGLGGVRAVAFRFYMYWDATSFSFDNYVARLSHNPDATAMTINVNIVGTGPQPTAKLQLLAKGSTVVWDAAANFPTQQWVRIEAYVQQGVTASDGSIQLAYYLGSSTTAIETKNASGLNFGGDLGALTNIRFGTLSSDSLTETYWLDTARVHTGTDATGLIGPPVNTPPTVTVGANQNVTAGATVNLTATASDSDGSIAAYAWSFLYPTTGAPTLTGASTATPSFTAGTAGSLYVLKCEVTDNGGSTASATVEVRVPKSTDFAPLPMDGVAVGAWTRAGSATTDGAALADSDDTTYVESPDFTASVQSEEYRLEPLVARDTLTLTLRALQTAAGGTVQAQLVEGTTVRQTWTITPGTSAGNSPLVVSNPAAITDWGNLRLRVTVVS